VSLTVGTGPFSNQPVARFNFTAVPAGPALLWDPVPQRVRAVFAGQTIVDTRAAKLLHETGRLPVYYFPLADVQRDLLEPARRSEHTAHKGEARFWSIRVVDRRTPDAVWGYPEPVDSAGFLTGYVALEWSAVDEWFVEDEQVFGHPRDPYHRIDVYETTRRVRILLRDDVVAESSRPKVLFETALPPRYYLPREDVRRDLLEPSSTKTRCAYKGSAAYWHVRAGGELHDDLVWTYPDPQHDAEPVRDLLCFFNERVDLELDGEIGERPITQWSR
jgi:uncharacterized protein (DUF427 family)